MAVAQLTSRLSLKNILLATDLSPCSQTALACAAAIARRYGSKVYIVHAVPLEPPLPIPLEPMPLELDQRWVEARLQMADFLRPDPLQGTPHEVLLERGMVWDVLSNTIARHQIDLLVLGTHGRQGVRKLLLGSVAEEIFRLAECPVLTVGPDVAPQDTTAGEFHHILFATDFSPGSLHALPYALSLAQQTRGNLTLLHLIPLLPLQDQEHVMAAAVARLKELLPESAQLWCQPEFLVRFEFPAEGILQAAAEKHADLVVMGVRRAAAPKASTHLPWATAHEVVVHAHCPVLTVRG